MDVDFILKLAGVGMIVTVICQVLSRAGRDEQSTLVSVGGIIFVLIILAEELGRLISTLRGVFGI
jgi:stage III sporulation protein AC